MDILVCIKQVPASNKVEVDPVTGVLLRNGADSKMNPYDLKLSALNWYYQFSFKKIWMFDASILFSHYTLSYWYYQFMFLLYISCLIL